jgi:formyltetrahydrofolate deformylase
MAEHRYTLTLACPDQVGIVAAVSGFVAQHGGSIMEASYHTDQETQQFFMRQEIRADSLPFNAEEFRTRFAPLAAEFQMTWQVSDSDFRKRVVLLVSQHDHCLSDLLHRWRSGELRVDIPCVISNHSTLREFVEWHGIPFHHIEMPKDNDQAKAAGFAEIARQFDAERGDVMVLARFMHILPPDLCGRYAGRIINIHHSFLPSFAGAKPYHQAYHRGVKLIGASCHYASAELAASPIIEQDTMRIDHGDSLEDMVRFGKDIEKVVLARGLRYHVEDRVLICGNKTVVFH